MKSWAIYIDIEGFSEVYLQNRVHAIGGLRALMEGIYAIGTTVCADTPDRLFVHQISDGFLISSEFGRGSPHLPIAIAVILMRKALLAGCLTKAGISEGEGADIQGCYPDAIIQHMRKGVVRLGAGLMRVFPVMGTDLINSHRITTKVRGSLLLLDAQMAQDHAISSVALPEFPDRVAIDWIHVSTSEIKRVSQEAKISLVDSDALEHLLQNHANAANTTVPEYDKWLKNTLKINGCGGVSQ
jgi:hypothetical protein